MFGLISSASREAGADGLIGTADDTFTKCGSLPASPSSLSQTLAGLNCGNLRFDPITQGVVTPTDANSVDLVTGNVAMNGDFFQSDDAHQGITLQNNFQWKNPATDPCGATGGPTPPPPSPTNCTSANFSLFQVGPLLQGQSGTLLAPGAGEQIADFQSSWVTNNTSTTAFDPPTVTWSQSLTEPQGEFFNPAPGAPASPLPCQTTGGTSPSLIQCGSFTYNLDTSFPQVHYPLGESQSSLVQGTIP
jgi:hypothetical protein